ncbi:choice-of-anchor D domain-containing protein [Luteolibacter pohnpeiensis]|uniref:Choice-of-anchor D domain-containing protein n=1 Tax=Luteolibacter pohnpeiensis TaxID=454153 RepID=A0A934VVW5_9BACT|nr:LamG-like jellyroll fold domain-containing protein [Luteolibacter pohnpeiensis]MBK1884002.1 choice-of-anchor D domain-containing protein [Luteolibacter pohnpeiensis]
MKFNVARCCVAVLSLIAVAVKSEGSDLLTYHNNLSRTGAILDEVTLNTSNVNPDTFGMRFNRPVDDEIYSQILYVSNVVIPGRGTHNVIYVATVNNTVYAYDADYPDESAPLWVRNFNPANGRPVRNTDLSAGGACGGNYQDFSGNIGIVGTPVIDPTPFPGSDEGDQGTIYFVTRTKANGIYDQYFHAVDIRNGESRPNSPMLIQGAVEGTGSGSVDGIVPFNSFTENQRPGLALVNGVVYIGWASHCDLGPYHGWLMGYNATTLEQEVVFNLTPDGVNGGIWMGGQAPSADEEGNLYINSGNGTIGTGSNLQGTRNRGMSFAKLTRSGSTLNMATFFTPYNYNTLEAGDVDLGSTGLLLVPDTNPKIAIGAGKQGRMYVVNRDNMGGYNAGGSSDTNVIQSIDVKLNNKIMGSPVYWKGPDGTQRIYVWCANDSLKAYTYNPSTGKLNLPPVASSVTTANPGAMLSVTANGDAAGTGIIWAMCPTANANQQVVPGYFRAFNAEDPTEELWNSQMNSARDDFGNYAKFNPPTVVKGKVFLPTFSNQVAIYGLIESPVVPETPTNLQATAASKTQVDLAWVDAADNEAGYRIERSVEGSDFALLTTVEADVTAYSDLTAQPFVHYEYRVRGFTSSGSSEFSNVSAAFTNAGDPAAEIVITGNGAEIEAGSVTPDATNGTDFGAIVLPGGAAVTQTFTIKNIGNSDLLLSGNPVVTITGEGASSFEVNQFPTASIAGDSSAEFQITFSTTEGGLKEALVTITNNDADEGEFSFAIQGRGVLQDLAAWFKFNETEGVIAKDSSGNGNDGTLVGPPLPVHTTDGWLGGALEFNGTTNQSVSVPSSDSLNPTSAITVSAWMLPQQWGDNANRRIIQKGTSDNQYRMCAESGVFKWDIRNIGTVTIPQPTLGTWCHVTGTYDGSSMKFYLNGVLASQLSTSGNIPVTDDALQISTKNVTSNGKDHFVGLIDDLRIYGRALSAQEILALASQTGVVSVVATDPTAQKAGDQGLFTFSRSGSVADELKVNFSLATGAGQGVYRTDFGLTPLPPVLTIPAGSSTATLSVNPLYLDQPTGPLSVTVTVDEGDGYAVGDDATAIVALADSPLNQWKIEQFGDLATAQSEVANDDADVDHDGSSTLLEFAFGLNPTVPDVAAAATVALEEIGGSNYLTITYRRPTPKLVGISYMEELSSDLSGENWSAAVALDGYPVDNGDGTETMKCRSAEPVGSQKTGFGRIYITRP